jgi:hypothetical protein
MVEAAVLVGAAVVITVIVFVGTAMNPTGYWIP